MSLFDIPPGDGLKELRDQPLHAFECALFGFLFIIQMPIWAGALLGWVYMFRRELEQHNWDWRRVGVRDLFFAGVGAFLLAVGYTLSI